MANKKAPSRGWRLGRFGGSAGRTARRICVLSGATLPPMVRLTLSHRYPRTLALPAFQKTRGALGELAAHICDGAAELDLQREPRQRLDQRGISGLLGDGLAKLAIARSISFHVSALQGVHGFN